MTKLKMIIDGKGGGYIEDGDPATYFPEMWREIIDKTGASSVLDVGCAEGHAMRWFKNAGLKVEGCEYSLDAIKKAPVEAVQHDLELAPYVAKKKPDIIWCCEVATY